MRAKLGVFLALALSAFTSTAASAPSLDSTIRGRIDSTSPVGEVLRSFLIAHVERADSAFDDADSSCDAKVRYSVDSVSLADSGPRADLVYLTGPIGLCGSGGCTTLIIDRSATSPRIVPDIVRTTQPAVPQLKTH